MVEADTHVVWDQFSTEGLKGPALWGPFVLVVVTQYKVARSRFVAGEHCSCAARLSPLGGVLGWPLRMDIKTKDET